MGASHSHQAFENAYSRHAQAIFRFIYFKISNYAAAEDLTSETFIRFWKRAEDGVIIQNDKAFLYVIARGLAVDYYRKSNHADVHLDEIDEKMLPVADDTVERISRKEEMSKVLAAMGTLKDEYREALVLYYVEELTVPEIASLLNKKENATRVLIHRALKSLKTAV